MTNRSAGPNRAESTLPASEAERHSLRRTAASVEEHLALVTRLLEPLQNRPAEPTPVSDALGRVTHSDVVSPCGSATVS